MTEVLVLSPDREARIALASMLRESGFTVTALTDRGEARALLGAEREDLGCVLLDLGDATATVPPPEELVRAVHREAPRVAIVVLVAHPTDARRGTLVEAGAADVLDRNALVGADPRPLTDRLQALLRALRAAQPLRDEVAGLRRQAALLREFEDRRYRVVGEDPAFLAVLEQAKRLASIPRPVLIVGERGTGKEMVAALMHFGGSRAAGPFVTVNCAAFQGTLLEAELFGHEKGAFTGADRRRPGRFELADGGTLFLDEVGLMAPEFQEKALRVIEYQEFERVRGDETIRVNVRVVAGTNADLAARIAEGKFRPDLYDRLAFAVVTVPPLRQRPRDIPRLVAHFVERMCAEVADLQPKRFHEDALAALERYRWPGNVRELRNVVERLLCTDTRDPIVPGDLPPEVVAAAVTTGAPGASAGGFETQVAEVEQRLLREALAAARGSQKAAAERLGLRYDQFRHLLRKYGIAYE